MIYNSNSTYRNKLNFNNNCTLQSQLQSVRILWCIPVLTHISSRPGTPTSSPHITEHLPTASPPGILDTLPPVTGHSQLVSLPSGKVNSSLPITQHLAAASPPICSISNPPNSQHPHVTSPRGILTSIPLTAERRPPACRLATWRRSQQDYHNQE